MFAYPCLLFTNRSGHWLKEARCSPVSRYRKRSGSEWDLTRCVSVCVEKMKTKDHERTTKGRVSPCVTIGWDQKTGTFLFFFDHLRLAFLCCCFLFGTDCRSLLSLSIVHIKASLTEHFSQIKPKTATKKPHYSFHLWLFHFTLHTSPWTLLSLTHTHSKHAYAR